MDKYKGSMALVAGLLLSAAIFVACEQNKDVANEAAKTEVTMANDEMAGQDSEAMAWNKMCPVSGKEIDAEIATVSYAGKAYGFCCSGCDDKFTEDPAKFSLNLSADGTEFLADKSEKSSL